MKKAIGIFIFFIIFAVAGLYAGGYFFLKFNKLNMNLLSFHVLFDYQSAYGHLAALKKPLFLAWLVTGFIAALPLFMAVALLLSKDKRELHGSARFANAMEIRQAGLFPNNGKKPPKYPSLIIGKSQGQYLYWHSNEFALLAAPTRGGKGIGLVVPNLLHYSDSVVVFDPKGENWELTAGFRAKHGQECFLFSPDSQDGKTHRWNPLGYIRRDPRFLVADVGGIAQLLYPTNSSSDGTNKFFNDNAQALFMGLVLYLIHQEKREQDKENTTLAAILNMTTPVDKSFKEWILDTIKEHEKMADPLSKECVSALLSYANTADNTAAGILSSMTAPFNVFRDPLVAKATSGNDFDLLQLRQKKMSIYIKLTPDNIAKFSVLVNLLFSQIINLNVRQGLPEHNKALKYQCLLMLDEFTALGYIGIIESAIAYIAGYNIRLCLIFQNKSQLDRNYKEGKDTLISNCALKIFFTPDRYQCAQELSEILGYETVKSKSNSKSRGKTGSTSQSESDQKRALMMPQELLQMPFEDTIVWLRSNKLMKIDKVMYFKDKNFNDRVSWPVPEVPNLFEPDNTPEPEPEEALDHYEIDIPAALRLAEIEQNAREQRERDALLAGAFDDLEGADTADFKANLAAALSDNTVTTYLQKMHNFTDNSDDNTADNQTNKETAS